MGRRSSSAQWSDWHGEGQYAAAPEADAPARPGTTIPAEKGRPGESRDPARGAGRAPGTGTGAAGPEGGWTADRVGVRVRPGADSESESAAR